MEKLSRDLDIVNLLDIVKGFHVMKQVLFNQDDRFFLHLQRRDMIYSSDTSLCEKEEQGRDSLKLQLEESLGSGLVFDQEKANTLRKVLNRFQGRQLEDREFRILQGVFKKNFGSLEQRTKHAKAFKK